MSVVSAGVQIEQGSLMTQTETSVASSASAASATALFDRIWPAGVVFLGFVLNAAWIALLGYGLVSLVSFAL